MRLYDRKSLLFVLEVYSHNVIKCLQRTRTETKSQALSLPTSLCGAVAMCKVLLIAGIDVFCPGSPFSHLRHCFCSISQGT